MKRRKRLNPVNRERRKREYERAYGKHAEWIRTHPCAVKFSAGCWGRTEAAHTESGGMGRKADARTLIALCHGHHMDLHTMGVETFQERFGKDLESLARWYWQRSPYNDEREAA